MKRLLSIVPIFLLLLASVAVSQTPVGDTTKTLVFNLELLEFSPDLLKDIEKLAQDRSRLDRLTADGKVRPMSDLQIRTRPGEPASIRMGQRVPTQIASSVQGIPQIQYENTGLSVDISPSLAPADRVLASLKVELSFLAKNGTPNPTFCQRSYSSKVNLKPNEKALLFSIVQQGSLWPSVPNQPASDATYGNYVLLLTVRVVD